MRRILTVTFVSFSVLFFSTLSTAAPTTVTFALTGGSQNWTSNAGPIVSGTLTLTVDATGCAQPAVSGTDGCVNTLTFETSQGHTHKRYDYFFSHASISQTGPGHARICDLSLINTSTDGTHFRRFLVHQSSQGLINRTNLNYTIWRATFAGTPAYHLTYSVLDIQGAEVGYPPKLPVLGAHTRILLSTLILGIPFLLMHRRHRAARAKRRFS